VNTFGNIVYITVQTGPNFETWPQTQISEAGKINFLVIMVCDLACNTKVQLLHKVNSEEMKGYTPFLVKKKRKVHNFGSQPLSLAISDCFMAEYHNIFL